MYHALPGASSGVCQDSTWQWPEREVREALSYIRILPHDLALRDDYVRRDGWRLDLVDSMMTHPWEMSAILQKQATIADSIPSIQTLLAELLGVTPPDPEAVAATFPTGTEKLLLTGMSQEWQDYLYRIMSAIADTGHSTVVELAATEDTRHLITHEILALLQEDIKDKDKSPEALDQQQKAEDSLAARLARAAGSVRWTGRLHPMARQIDRLLESLPDSGPGWPSVLAYSARPGRFETSLGTVMIGTAMDDQFVGDPAVIIDPGGNDEYRLDPQTKGQPRLIIDWGGNDLYVADSGKTLGCGYWSWGLLIDRSGDDIYRGGNITLGAGWFGIGVLVDMDGADIYSGDTHTQGAGGFGLGVLCDLGTGNDTYIGRLYSQGFGFVAGGGALIDNGGNDNYIAGGRYEDVLRYRDHYLSLSQGFGYGFRPHSSGGVGLLIDLSGNDTYTADIFGQGASYWWGFGGLFDGGGNDHYIAHQYAQGAATHMTAGCLFDRSGDDSYSAKGVSQGCGHDWSPGFLIDADGNDRYSCSDLSQAAGSANGVGVLIDANGNDFYAAEVHTNTQGYGNPRRDYGSIGMFLDLGGNDRYDGPGGDSKVWLSRSMWGVGVDADSAWLARVRPPQ